MDVGNVLSKWKKRVTKLAEVESKHVVFEDDVKKDSDWDYGLVDRVFHSVSWVSDDQFLEELRYTLITSPLLNDFTPREVNHSITNSIMDFHKNGVRSQYTKLERVLVTKLGSLKVYTVNKNFDLIQTVDFMSIHRYAYSILKYLLKRDNSKNIKTPIIVVLIVLYLGFEQSHFHSQYKKYALLVQLKSLIKKSQRFDALLKRFHEKYLSSATGNQKIESLLFSIGTLTVIKYSQFAEYLINYTNIEQLSKYCGIYGIQVGALLAIKKNTKPQVDRVTRVEELVSQTDILRKFILCCFLSMKSSVNNDTNTLTGFTAALGKIFPRADIMNEEGFQDWSGLVTVTKKFNQDTDNLFCTLNEQKELLYWLDDHVQDSPHNPRNLEMLQHKGFTGHSAVINESLHQIQILEQELLKISNESSGNEMQALLNDHINQIRHIIKKNIKSQTKYNIFSNNGKNRSSISGKGLFLDVLKSPVENEVTKFESLDVLKPVITTVSDDDELESIVSDGNDEPYPSYFQEEAFQQVYSVRADTDSFEIYEEPPLNIEGIEPPNQAGSSIENLSDEQLRKRLNEKIKMFATENKRNRERLRTKKSLELLRGSSDPLPLEDRTNRENSYSDIQVMLKNKHTNSRRKNKKLYSEETIPLYYEISEMISNKSQP